MLPSKYFLLLSAFDYVQQEIQLMKFAKTMQDAEKQQKATEIIRNHMGFALGAGLVPVPGADLVAVSAVQLNMLRQLAKLYDVGFFDSLGNSVISAVVGGSIARLGASLVKALPGVGTVIGEFTMPVLSGASTYALGKVVAAHLHKGGTLEDLDLSGARKKYKEEVEEGNQLAKEMHANKGGVKDTKTASEEAMDKIKQAAELRDNGVLTEEEFKALKDRLLSQV